MRLVFGNVLQRNIDTFIELFTILVVQYSVAVGKCAAPAVFARQAHRKAFRYQCGKGHVLAHAPVHSEFAASHGGAIVQHLAHQWVHVKRCWYGGNAFCQTFPLVGWNSGVGRVSPFGIAVGHPVHRKIAFVAAEYWVDGAAAFDHGAAVGLHHLVAQCVAQALCGQTVGIEFARARVLVDFFIHQRLREHGRILLVVAKLTETHDVNDHVFVESGAVVHGPLHTQGNGFGVVAIDVQHGRVHHLDHIGAVQG